MHSKEYTFSILFTYYGPEVTVLQCGRASALDRHERIVIVKLRHPAANRTPVVWPKSNHFSVLCFGSQQTVADVNLATPSYATFRASPLVPALTHVARCTQPATFSCSNATSNVPFSGHLILSTSYRGL